MRTVAKLAYRELCRMGSKPIYIFCMIVAPLFCYIFFTTLMKNGLPTNLPIAVVDNDNTSVSRTILRNLDSFQQVEIVAQYSSVTEARTAMQRGEVFAFFYIPAGTTEKTLRSEQPTISFYSNATYLIPASLLYRDMRMMSEYASAGVARETLYAKGYTEDEVMGILQPIVIDIHPINNPTLNYNIYLSNTILPGILALIIMLVTVYSIYEELKHNTVAEWLNISNDNIVVALIGKLLPQTIIFFVMALLYLVYLYGFLDFPLNSGILPMLLNAFLLIIASQSFAVFICGCIPSMRWSLSLCTLWGVLAFPISGFSFPTMAMHPTLQALSYFFPLRYYYLIYVDQALNGRAMWYSIWFYLCLLLFVFMPFLVLKRLHNILRNFNYTE